ncbi:hypothetical protein F4Z99_19870 [Candidatus Poribacteria bacterium]|nr:hypothetical protein [Candidatus Poribacteria bacterium]MYB01588.1 hypothetical protein [Candidatus Poribacteria bacterium]
MIHKRVFLFLLLGLFCVAITFSGCTVTFTQSDTLQLSLSELTDKAMSLVAEFEAGEADNIAGDVTQQAGSVCAGGACIIY